MKTAALACLLCLFAASVPAAGFGPWSADARHPLIGLKKTVTRGVNQPARSSSPFVLAFGLWSKLLTRMDGPRCMHRPSCSTYAIRAMSRQSLIGFWKALSRLMRGPRSSAIRMLPLARLPGGIYYLDPL
ncbi:MAG TPA: membrane protein insertion efficiency factor YidD [Myxococcota bacterium]|nr:membrane protein insertion efficiency factor YidD [Myxococcota bacterium]